MAWLGEAKNSSSPMLHEHTEENTSQHTTDSVRIHTSRFSKPRCYHVGSVSRLPSGAAVRAVSAVSARNSSVLLVNSLMSGDAVRAVSAVSARNSSVRDLVRIINSLTYNADDRRGADCVRV